MCILFLVPKLHISPVMTTKVPLWSYNVFKRCTLCCEASCHRIWRIVWHCYGWFHRAFPNQNEALETFVLVIQQCDIWGVSAFGALERTAQQEARTLSLFPTDSADHFMPLLLPPNASQSRIHFVPSLCLCNTNSKGITGGQAQISHLKMAPWISLMSLSWLAGCLCSSLLMKSSNDLL